MKKPHGSTQPPTDTLRERAEERLSLRPLHEKVPTAADLTKLVHELQVHQVELEMQNEELARSRAEIADALARYAELYDFAPVGYFTVDTSGTIRSANLTGARMFDAPRDALLGQRFAKFFHDASAITRVVEATFAGPYKRTAELDSATSAGSTERRCLQLSLACAPNGGECTIAVVDVTERRLAESRLASSQKMDALGRMAGGVAHDFNNLLTVMLTYTDLALAYTDLDPAIREDLLGIRGAAETSASLTRQLLAFSRKKVVGREILALNAVITDLQAMLQKLVGEHIVFTLDLSTDGGTIEANFVQLEQVVMNLVVNARDAMPRGGHLTLATALEITNERAWVVLRVTDDGVGMDSATTARIFEPFFTTKDVEHGTGFGLSTVYGIVHQYGGDISVASVPNRGTTFLVRFPRAIAPAETAKVAPLHAATPTGGTETVLIVEDEPALRKVAKRILSASGYTVHVADGGEAALELCAAIKFDLALVDVVMPKMSGLVFAERLAKLCPSAKVLFMSGYVSEHFENAARERPLELIEKPFTSAALRTRVREVLGPKN